MEAIKTILTECQAAPAENSGQPSGSYTRTDEDMTARTKRAEARTEQAEARAEQSEARSEQAEAQSEQAIFVSELKYRRLFEAAKDGILILDAKTGCITDANPFLVELLGSSLSEMVGKTVGELSPFKDIESNQAMLERLQEHGYVRYEDLPLETTDNHRIAVEFVSNVYQAGDEKVIQCNIRDITKRKQAESKYAVSTPGWNNESSNARRNCKLPTRNWRHSVIRFPMIYAHRCAMSCRCQKKVSDI
jgi:PAS domain S-box-containing protein